MKKCLVCLIVIISFTNSDAQNPHLDYKYALKVYNLSSFEQVTDNRITDTLMPSVQRTSTMLNYIHPTLAFQWKTKKQNFREIEFISLYVNKKTNQYEELDSAGKVVRDLGKNVMRSSGMSVRYEYTVMFKKSKTSAFVPSLSYAANLYFNTDHLVPGISNNFKSMQSVLGAKGFIIPRLNYFIGQRLFLDLNLPICVMDFAFRVDQNENPSIPTNQQRISNFNFELFPKVISVRIGVGIKI